MTINCFINGHEIEVKKGTKIIEVFKQNNIPIAHFCWHPALSIAGVCRLCYVEIEGYNNLQLACNTEILDGMVITNKSEKVKKAVRWNLEYHLINHPIDCPICDQSGECALQEQYMMFGLYNSKMAVSKVKKRKAINIGSKVVLDSERCILCTKCVRFTREISKTYQLGIFNRGDKSEVGTFNDQPFEDNYSLNTVDICPVGALTSKDFRFKQRVWFLKKRKTICIGCSTGCNIELFFNKNGAFRIKPFYNEKINKHWMCDEGRNIYKWINKENRLLDPYKIVNQKKEKYTIPDIFKEIREIVEKSNDIYLVITAQYTNEELENIINSYLTNNGNIKNIFYWQNNLENFNDFDGFLLRGDRNPNTQGLMNIFNKNKINNDWGALVRNLENKKVDVLLVAAPENTTAYHDIDEKIELFSKSNKLIWFSVNSVNSLSSLSSIDSIDSANLGNLGNLEKLTAENFEKKFSNDTFLIPLKAFTEKNGTFTNYQNINQNISSFTHFSKNSINIDHAFKILFESQELESQKLFAKFKVNNKHENNNQKNNNKDDQDYYYDYNIESNDHVLYEHQVKNEFFHIKENIEKK